MLLILFLFLVLLLVLFLLVLVFLVLLFVVLFLFLSLEQFLEVGAELGPVGGLGVEFFAQIHALQGVADDRLRRVLLGGLDPLAIGEGGRG